MSDELSLYVSTSIEIEMEVDACGLKIVVSQAILDICEWFTSIEQIHGSGMPEAVDRVDDLQTF